MEMKFVASIRVGDVSFARYSHIAYCNVDSIGREIGIAGGR